MVGYLSSYLDHHLVIDKMSEAYKRVTAGSFKIKDRVMLERDLNGTGRTVLRIDWTCACGTHEALSLDVGDDLERAPHVKGSLVDAGALIEMVNANGIQHLIDDGFTDEQIRAIRVGYPNDPPVEAIRDPEGYAKKLRERERLKL